MVQQTGTDSFPLSSRKCVCKGKQKCKMANRAKDTSYNVCESANECWNRYVQGVCNFESEFLISFQQV